MSVLKMGLPTFWRMIGVKNAADLLLNPGSFAVRLNTLHLLRRANKEILCQFYMPCTKKYHPTVFEEEEANFKES